MSIELSNKAISPKATMGAENAKGKQDDKAVDSEAGGFSSILSSIEQPSELNEVAVSVAEDKSTIGIVPDAASLNPAPVIPVIPNMSDPGLSLPSDLAMLLAQAGQVAGDKPEVTDDGRATDRLSDMRLTAAVSMPDVLTAKSGFKAERVNAEVGLVPNEGKSEVVTAMPAGEIAPKLLGSAANQFEVDSAKLSAGLDTGHVDDVKQKDFALLEIAAQTASGPNQKIKATPLSAGALFAESRAMMQSSLADVAAREPVLSGALLNNGFGDGVFQKTERSIAKSSFPVSGSGIESVWGSSPFSVGNHADTVSMTTDSAMPSLESAVADKVSYWVTQGVQNAELKLDGFGGESVQVSITLKGDQTHIGFRTDQPEIRQMLEGAVAHLKESLSSEGLVLSGVSVGASGQNGAGSQEQSNRQGAGKKGFVTVETLPTENLQRIHKSVGRTLDLYA